MTTKADLRQPVPGKGTAILPDEPLRLRELILALLLSSIIVIPTWIMIWRQLP
ncbi:hypothetical protein [Microvirga terricola]|uniref:ABC transporter permease n=1 Tax=Microvirga terricola TaxID=2719797 RepID=A0ABX0VH15_9HYPH|nr:hypothetical protein [Microvirga terricola]NIX77881.1 hypothetical protein [Microvirga terricola]